MRKVYFLTVCSSLLFFGLLSFNHKGKLNSAVLGDTCDIAVNSDIDCSGKVDLVDFTYWLENYKLALTPTPVLTCGLHSFSESGVCICHDRWGNCNNDMDDGCEVSLTSISNCGSCGNVCPSSGAHFSSSDCITGSCNLSCDNYWEDCNNSVADGCETDLTSNAHCGSCTNVCSGGTTCVNGRCSSPTFCPGGTLNENGICVCDSNHLNCDELQENGCEVNWKWDVRNCGGCGIVCSAGKSCSSGVCTP